MDSTTSHQSFVSLFESLPGSRHPSKSTLSSSIWAPQPQPSETTWSKAIDAINRVDYNDGLRPSMRRAASHSIGYNSTEDVFGPVGLGYQEQVRKKSIGAIGDGRRKTPPEQEALHTEQLFRSLNLNSPGPFPPPPAQMEFPSSSNSPTESPISTTSGLMTPPDFTPAKTFSEQQWRFNPGHALGSNHHQHTNKNLLFQTEPPRPYYEVNGTSETPYIRSVQATDATRSAFPRRVPSFEPFNDTLLSGDTFSQRGLQSSQHRVPSPPRMDHWSSTDRLRSTSTDWVRTDDVRSVQRTLGQDNALRQLQGASSAVSAHEPINFLSLLHPSSAPPYHLFVARIIKSSDQQASIFLQQKLKVADVDERAKIVDAICTRGFEMMAHRFGNWAVQRCLEATASPEERRKIINCMRGRVVELATNCYGCHVLQKALDCEEDVRLLIVSELLLGDPAQTLVNKHASHVWSKVMELTWTSPAPPIFAYVNKSLKGKWASLACHETGSLVVQHAFENLEDSAKDGIVDEILNQGVNVFSEVAKSQWGSYCIQHILEHGSTKHRSRAVEHLLSGLLDFSTNEQGFKSVTKALKEGGKDTLDRVIRRMSEPANGSRRAMVVDLALSTTGSQLIASVLPQADKDQRALLYDSIRGHIVTLRGCKTGSKVIWLFDRMRAYYGY